MASISRHSQGPWTVGHYPSGWTINHPSGIVAELNMLPERNAAIVGDSAKAKERAQERAANALILAAALELLEACQAVIGDMQHDDRVGEDTLSLVIMAVAKAEGRIS